MFWEETHPHRDKSPAIGWSTPKSYMHEGEIVEIMLKCHTKIVKVWIFQRKNQGHFTYKLVILWLLNHDFDIILSIDL